MWLYAYNWYINNVCDEEAEEKRKINKEVKEEDEKVYTHVHNYIAVF